MSLSLYRRHSRVPGKCAGGHQPDAQTYESDERRRAWKRCSCPIYASGTIGGHFRRVNTKQVVWDEAKVVAASWEAAGAWPEVPPARPGGRVISELIGTDFPNTWWLRVEYTNFGDPLRKTVAVAEVEVRDSEICKVRYSHHEDHVRATPHGIWQPPVQIAHKELDRLRNDLERAATLVWGIAGQEGEDG
ncbi:MAG: hypothetical protein ABSE56_05040 [Bryobacteraceae bacterium]|jgi:hypothetical protein